MKGQWVARRAECHPWWRKIFQKLGKTSEKIRKKKWKKSGKNRKNWEETAKIVKFLSLCPSWQIGLAMLLTSLMSGAWISSSRFSKFFTPFPRKLSHQFSLDWVLSFSGYSRHLMWLLFYLCSPVWTLKENKGKIHLDLCWSKFPATSPQVTSQPEPARAGSTSSINDQKQRGPDSASHANALPTPVKEISPTAPSSKTKKKKSPATKKRDRERLVKWLSHKRSGISHIKSSSGNLPAATVKKTSESALDKKTASTQSTPASCEDFKLPDVDVRLSPVTEIPKTKLLIKIPIVIGTQAPFKLTAPGKSGTGQGISEFWLGPRIRRWTGYELVLKYDMYDSSLSGS